MIINVIGICIILFTIWFLIEIWKAPLLRENPDGSYTTIKESKKIMDFFKKKNKN
jgi:hypothetical protein